MSIEELLEAVNNSNMETEAKAEIRELIKAGHNVRIEEKLQQRMLEGKLGVNI